MNAVEKIIQYLNDQIPNLIDFLFGVLLALIVFAIGSKLIKWVRKIVRKSLNKANADKGVEQFIDSLLKFGLYAVLLFSIGKNFGLDTTTVAALLASGGVAIGLALQGSLSNFAGGVLILLLKPFVVGDYIIENNTHCEGTVTEIQIFYTKLSTVDQKTIVLPNGTLANHSLVNLTTQGTRKIDLKVSVSYASDLKKAKEILREVLLNEEGILKDQEIQVFVSELGESAVVFGVRGFVKTEEYWPVRWRILENVKLSLDANEIEIPYQQITVHMEK